MKPKLTKIPSPAYRPLKLDMATRMAQQKAALVQPPMMALASKVASFRKDGG
jgi:hypothetical protein